MEMQEVLVDFIEYAYSGPHWRLELTLSSPKSRDDILVVHLRGAVHLETISWGIQMMSRLIEHGFRYLVIDYSGVELSGSGTASLIQVVKQAHMASGAALIAAPTPAACDVLELLGFAQFDPIEETVDSAVQRLASKEKDPSS